MRPLPASPPQRIAAAVAVISLGGVGFVPLFGGPGYEAALAAGVVLPAAAAIATSLDVLCGPFEPLAAVRRGVASGTALAALALVLSLLHGLRAGFCDVVEGVELFVLGPAMGAVLGGVWGAVVGLAAARVKRRARLFCALFALAGPIAGIVLSVRRFYTSPMVFAFDPFFGFFAGTLYDSVINGMSRLVTYRAVSATLVAVFSTAALFDRAESGEARLVLRGRFGVALLAVAAAVASVTHIVCGEKMGHYQTTASIRDALGEHVEFGRCDLVYPSGTPALEARALARECDGHLAQLDRFFGVSGPEQVVAFVFANPGQKGYLMGAATTYIAKPWRREIDIQRDGFPHPVMRHELAHVVAGTFGSGPFRVAGPFDGIIPDPGRIEGVAVAAAPHDEDLSLEEWAKAMRDLHLLPPLERVFKLSFLGEPSSRAYVVAGAFIDWLRRERGIDAVKAWYGGASLEHAAGAPLGELERRWLASLDHIVVGEDVLRVARARFDRPAIFGRRCPHVVDRIAGEANAALAGLDTARARKLYRDVLALDPHDVGARLGLATCSERDGEEDCARKQYRAIADDGALGKSVRARALESLGDLSLTAGEAADARRAFDEVATSLVDADRLRALDVKRYAITSPGKSALIAQIIGDPSTGRDPGLAAASLGAWSVEEPKNGLADYLLSRIYAGEGRWLLVAQSLDRALGKELAIPSVVREAWRLRATAACLLDDRAGVVRAATAWSKLDGSRPPEREEMNQFVERCTREPSPTVPAPVATSSSGAAAPLTSGNSSPKVAPLTSGSSSTQFETAPTASGAVPATDASAAPTTPGPSLRAEEGCGPGRLRIPAGEAWIGSPRGQGADDEWPRYRTRVASFCMDETEVTASAYAACVARGACTPTIGTSVTCTARGTDQPINCVDANQAAAFCKAEGARLPTETEWEYAASGGDDRVYSWGDEPPDGRTCWKNPAACPVKQYPAGAFGLFDMTGNVWEWTSSLYGDYPWSPLDAPNQVYRGGSWSRRFEKWMRVRLRDRAPPTFRGSHLGFRCVGTIPDVPCPFGRGTDGDCVPGVLAADCRPGKAWNGVRCAPPGEAGCPAGESVVPGHGCVRDVAVVEPKAKPLDTSAVHRVRSPEFDADCRQYQAKRPHAYRFEAGTHVARNQVERGEGCKNRDVGVGWNSACCP